MRKTGTWRNIKSLIYELGAKRVAGHNPWKENATSDRKRMQQSVADLGFSWGGGAKSPRGAPHTILSTSPKNCMKLKEFGWGGRPKFYYVDPPLAMAIDSFLDN